MATPNAMPKRTNPFHQQILSGLLATKPVSWIHKRIDPDSPDPKKPRVIETKIVGKGLVNALAANVSDENIERMGRRWL